MSDIHKAIRDRLETGRDFGEVEVQWFDPDLKGWCFASHPLWFTTISYRLIDRRSGDVVMISNRLPGQGDITNPSPATPQSDLTPAEYLDGCVKAAISLLMKPDRSIAEVRKARAWLTLGLEVADK